MGLDWNVLPDDEIVNADSNCPICKRPQTREVMTNNIPGLKGREFLGCREHGVTPANQNRNLVKRILGQLSNPGDVIFLAAGKKNPCRLSNDTEA